MESLVSFLFVTLLLSREVVFRAGPPLVVAVLVHLALGHSAKAEPGRGGWRRAAGIFVVLCLLWQLVVAQNPQWRSGWYQA